MNPLSCAALLLILTAAARGAAPTAPELWAPVAEGSRAWCVKGPLEPGTSHAPANEMMRFALDIASSATEPPSLVVASADGTAYPFGGCAFHDLNQHEIDDCNAGYGNLVRVAHSSSVFTQYAHLAALLVGWGQRVRRGDRIGIEGSSGSAGFRHLHWSLHRGSLWDLEAPSAPISGAESRACGDIAQSSMPVVGTRFPSDNEAIDVPDGFSSGVDASWPSTLERLVALGGPEGRRWAVRELERRSPDAENRYWLGAALFHEGELSRALALFLKAAGDPSAGAAVRAWSLIGASAVHAVQGQGWRARRRARAALRLAPEEERAAVAKAAARLEAGGRTPQRTMSTLRPSPRGPP